MLVSIQYQNLDLQKNALLKNDCQKIYENIASEAKSSRTGLDEALAYLQEVDALVIWNLERLGRSLKHLIEVVTSLHERGIGCKSHLELKSSM